MNTIRPLTFEEQLSLSFWQGTDDIRTYLIARTLSLSNKNWHVANIALALEMGIEEVEDIIRVFNQNGLAPLAPSTKAYARPHTHGLEYTQAATHQKNTLK